jgi:hypothetical protein
MKKTKRIEIETARTLYSLYEKSKDQKDYKVFLEYLNAVGDRISFGLPTKEFIRSRTLLNLVREVIEYCVREEVAFDTMVESLKVLGVEVED